MKQYLSHSIILLIAGFSFISCEDVIDIDTPSDDRRLIIDALIRVDTLQPLTKVSIKVQETNGFFETLPPAGLQQITLTGLPPDGALGAILIEEEPGSGIYSDLVSTEGLMSGEIFLQIDFEDEFFVAYATFQPTVPIDNLRFGDGGGFDGDDTELIVTFTDNSETEDQYLFDFDFGNFLVTEDEFYNGQQFEFSYFYDENLNPGDTLDISIMGIDNSLFNYMDLLIEQSEQDFGVFETPSLTVRGNIINATDIDNDLNFNNVNLADNFALGYFAIVQEYNETIIVE